MIPKLARGIKNLILSSKNLTNKSALSMYSSDRKLRKNCIRLFLFYSCHFLSSYLVMCHSNSKTPLHGGIDE